MADLSCCVYCIHSKDTTYIVHMYMTANTRYSSTWGWIQIQDVCNLNNICCTSYSTAYYIIRGSWIISIIMSFMGIARLTIYLCSCRIRTIPHTIPRECVLCHRFFFSSLRVATNSIGKCVITSQHIFRSNQIGKVKPPSPFPEYFFHYLSSHSWIYTQWKYIFDTLCEIFIKNHSRKTIKNGCSHAPPTFGCFL